MTRKHDKFNYFNNKRNFLFIDQKEEKNVDLLIADTSEAI